MISEDTLNKATYFEHIVFNEVARRKEDYLDSRIMNEESVERK